MAFESLVASLSTIFSATIRPGILPALALTALVALAQSSAFAETTPEAPQLGAQTAEIDITPQKKAATTAYHVTVGLKLGGNIEVRDVSATTGSTSTQKRPLEVNATLEYDERHLSMKQSARFYEKASATIRVDDKQTRPTLSEDRRLVLAEIPDRSKAAEQRILLHSPNDVLSREELDLIDVVGNTSVIDELLPETPVAKDGSWRISDLVMGRLLGLDSIAVCEVTATIDDANSGFVRFQAAGTVHGTVDGAATEFNLRAIALVDRKHHEITQLNLAVKEDRTIGPGTPGVEGVAKIRIKRTRQADASELSDAKLAAVRNAPPNPILTYHAQRQGFRLRHDRQWFAASMNRNTLTLRRVDDGSLAAQCTLTRFPAKAAERQTTFAKFEKDIRFALGDSLRDTVASDQWINAAGLRCMSLTARGIVKEAPVEWRYYLAVPEGDGPSISVATTIEQSLAGQVGPADRALVESLELVDPVAPFATASVDNSVTPLEAEAKEKAEPPIARSQRNYRKKTSRTAQRSASRTRSRR